MIEIKHFTWLGLFLASLLLTSCMSMGDNNEMISGSQSFLLSDAEVSRREIHANNGDGESAYELYMHYAFAKVDAENGGVWLSKAVELNNEKAIEHLKSHKDRPSDTHAPVEYSEESPF